jgi:hypothetical protein
MGTPVNNPTVMYSAPVGGPGGTFSDSGTVTTTAATGESGIATAAAFRANGLLGSYTVTATASSVVTPTSFLLTNFAWYVAPSGNDGNACLSPANACATINGTLSKVGFTAGDTVFVGAGTYTGTGNEVVLLDKNATLRGGWDGAFTTQAGASTIDGDGVRRGISVHGDVTAIVESFTVQNCSDEGGSITVFGTLTLTNSTVRNNMGNGIESEGGGRVTLRNTAISSNTGKGILNGGTLILFHAVVSDNLGGGIDNGSSTATLNNSTVSDNDSHGINNFSGVVTLNNSTVSGNTTTSYVRGGGIHNDSGTVFLNNSTVSGNTASNGGGIHNEHGTLILKNCTVSGNTAPGSGAGGGIRNHGNLTLQNTVLAGNNAGIGPDCFPDISSEGYNLIGDTSNCDFTLTIGDLIDVFPGLFPLIGSPGYHPLLPGSPAIDAGNPVGCVDHLGNLLDTDQRGVPRVGRCDIGSYEFDPANDPLAYVFLPIIVRFD